jgi:hypothetical protein
MPDKPSQIIIFLKTNLIYLLLGIFFGWLYYNIDAINEPVFVNTDLSTLHLWSFPLFNIINQFVYFVVNTHYWILVVVLVIVLFWLTEWYNKNFQSIKKGIDFRLIDIEFINKVFWFFTGVTFVLLVFLSPIILNSLYLIPTLLFFPKIWIFLVWLILAGVCFALNFFSKEKPEVQTQIYSIDDPIKESDLDNIIASKDGLFKDFKSNIDYLSEKIRDKNDNLGIKDRSITFCVDAQWGAGKTSFIKMVKDRLDGKYNSKDDPNDKNLIWIDFNPWNFSNSSELVEDFFKTLDKKVSKVYGKGLGGDLRKYIKLVTDVDKTGTFSIINSIIDTFSSDDSLNKLKENIKDKLQLIEEKIVIVLDDIDRMEPDEIMTVLKLVKLVADFPRLIFILPMDYDRVSNIIANKYTAGFESYLQKIIQYRIRLDDYTMDESMAILDYSFGKSDIPEDKFNELSKMYLVGVWGNFIKKIRTNNEKTDSIKLKYGKIENIHSNLYENIKNIQETISLYNNDNNLKNDFGDIEIFINKIINDSKLSFEDLEFYLKNIQFLGRFGDFKIQISYIQSTYSNFNQKYEQLYKKQFNPNLLQNFELDFSECLKDAKVTPRSVKEFGREVEYFYKTQPNKFENIEGLKEIIDTIISKQNL